MTAQVTEAPAAAAPPLLAVAGVDVVLGHGWRASQVLTGVDLDIWPGEIVGLVGETGSGKTTLARTIVGLVRPRQGRIVFAGTEISGLRRGARRRERRSGHVQLVFQDPLRSLDPDLTVAEIVGEGLAIRGGLDAGQISEQVDDALAKVPGRWPPGRGCCCATSRSARSTRATGTTSCGCSPGCATA
jgi:ABC-type glutathione transport system ATPase component